MKKKPAIIYPKTKWKSLDFTINNYLPALRTPDYYPDVDYTNFAYLFPYNNTAEYIIVRFPVPEDKLRDSGFFVEIEFAQNDATESSFTVSYRFQLEGEARNTTSASINSSNYRYTYSSGTLQQVIIFDELSFDNKYNKGNCELKIYRPAFDGFEGDIAVNNIKVRYKI